MKLHDALSDALGVDYTPEVVKSESNITFPLEPRALQSDEINLDAEADYKLARTTFRSLINKGNDAIEGITDLAKESESPRAYEVLATLMKTVADTTKDLFELQKKNKDLKSSDKSRPQDETRINVEKAVFVGSPSALLSKIKQEQKES